MLTKLFPFFKKEEPKVVPEPTPVPQYDTIRLELRYNPNSAGSPYEIWSVGYFIDSYGSESQGHLISCSRRYATRKFADEHLSEAEGIAVR